MTIHALKLGLLTGFLLLAAACAKLPDPDDHLQARHAAQSVQFENARGTLTRQKNTAILAQLKRKSPNLDILEKHIALEQALVDSPLMLGNKVTLLQDGAATYAAMIAAIRAAKDHINLETYIIEDDEVGRQFADLLLEQQARGIQVNLIYDSVGGINTPKTFFTRLAQAGIAVLEFNPVNPLKAKEQWLISNRDHRKLLIVDGETAFLGGINISSVYSAGSSVVRARTQPAKQSGTDVPWRDTHVQIDGPVVEEFQKLFIQTWEKQQGTQLAARQYFPQLKARGGEIVRAIGSSSDDPYSLIYLTLISAIDNAEKQVHLANAYFVPDPRLLKSLTGAAERGVDVKLILPGHSDSQTVFHAGRSHYTGLLRAGVKLYERQGALLHSKTAVIDGVWSTVGSTNLDWRSFLDNDEVNAVILGRGFAQQMEAAFTQDLAASDAIDLESWQRRPLLVRFKEWAARLWERLL